MIRIFVGAMVLTVLACSMFGQLPPGMLKGYKTHEDYCYENPKMPTCIKIQLPKEPFGTGIIYNPNAVPNGTPSPRVGRAPSQPRPSRPSTVQPRSAGPVSAIALQDWRFSHTSPAMLINVNIRSLLQSPLWKVLFSGWIAGSPQSREADLDKARAALGDIGQILISLSPNHTSTPSFLMLARGNVDSTLGAMLRSSAGMQAKRIDEFSLLVGDPSSMELADVRMKGKFPRSTFNALQQIATAESQKYDIWVGADPRNLGRMASLFGGANQAALAVLRSFSLGIYLRDQIRLEVAIEAPSPEIAQRILAAYHQQEAKKKKGDKDPFGGQTWLTVEGAKLQFIGIADAAQLKADPEFEAAMARIAGPQIGPVIQALAGMASVQRSAAESPKTKPGAIMIQGLDGGPKEIPTK